MTVKERIIKALGTIDFVSGENLFLQGSLGADDEYPAEFITFWIADSSDDSHYDDDVHSGTANVTLFYYSNSAKNVNLMPSTIRFAMKSAGFVPQGKGHDAPTDESTHTGWQMDFLCKDYE